MEDLYGKMNVPEYPTKPLFEGVLPMKTEEFIRETEVTEWMT